MLKTACFVQTAYSFLHTCDSTAHFVERIVQEIDERLQQFYVGSYPLLPVFLRKIAVRKTFHQQIFFHLDDFAIRTVLRESLRHRFQSVACQTSEFFAQPWLGQYAGKFLDIVIDVVPQAGKHRLLRKPHPHPPGSM